MNGAGKDSSASKLTVLALFAGLVCQSSSMLNQLKVYFDGGTTPGGSDGYGSWQVLFNGFSKCVSRQAYTKAQHGRAITNNVAEYLALLGALRWLQSVKDKELYSVHITGDSMLVINQVNKNWRTRKHHLQKLVDECCLLLEDFGEWQTEWKSRIHSVSRFGH